MLIQNVDVLVVPEAGECTVETAQDIHLDDTRITAVVPTGNRPGAGEVIDGRGLLAVPGLINSHTHSPMVLMRGAAEDLSIDDWFNRRIWPMEVNLTPERVRAGARLACAEMLLGGVTTFVDHYFHADQIAQAAIESGIRADLAPTYFSSLGAEGIDAAIATTRELATLHPRITAGLGPHATYTVSDDDLRRTADVARADGLRIHLHAAESDDQTQASLDKHQATPIEILDRTGVLDAGALIAHGCGIRAADLPILERHAGRTTVATCPKVYLKLAMGEVTPIKQLQAAKIRVGIGTDGAAVHNTLDVWEAIRLVALTQKHREDDAEWMTLSDTIRLATRGSAAAANQPDTLGALEPGRQADIALLDLSGPHNQPLHDPRAALVYSVRPSDVTTVLVAGQVVVRDRQLTTLDLAETLAEARAIAHTLTDLSRGGAVQHYNP
ncbi:amidohydrolase [Kribbella sandramycini]|uniref:5-methylthioadenosine/S-adenosylhomocysteine deaminase n=1 Tax=Kribbella sandramycini TaxID=60450 RepID=A0A7Y4P4Q1_9ACTN|nr:amidohydrolase [Kribbella sandramycini]MBB6570043.1 5-methylthioadenosine/S-adenosylhomocysteine deaminase [Kribbella sandramycini]NOL45454.1 amidohydrolase [Kribbella sandramycini]